MSDSCDHPHNLVSNVLFVPVNQARALTDISDLAQDHRWEGRVRAVWPEHQPHALPLLSRPSSHSDAPLNITIIHRQRTWALESDFGWHLAEPLASKVSLCSVSSYL